MMGCERRLERDMEVATFAAYQTARMTYYGDKKLKPLKDWLRELKGGKAAPPVKQSAPEMIAALRAVKATMGRS